MVEYLLHSIIHHLELYSKYRLHAQGCIATYIYTVYIEYIHSLCSYSPLQRPEFNKNVAVSHKNDIVHT